MKKVFKKFQMWMIALVAMFACSMVSFAQDVTIHFLETDASCQYYSSEKGAYWWKSNGVSAWGDAWLDDSFCYFSATEKIHVTSDDKNIAKIVSYDASNSVVNTWTGSSKDVVLGEGAVSKAVYSIAVYFEGTTPQPAEYKTGESISEGELDKNNGAPLYLYFNDHEIESVDATLITVGGETASFVGFWGGESIQINLANAVPLAAGDYTVVVPEGAIKFKDGKVNAEIELEYYVLPDPVYVNVFESAYPSAGEVTADLLNQGIYIYTDRVFEYKKNAVTVNGEEVYAYFGQYDKYIYVSSFNAEVGKTYTVVVPAGTILVADNTFNEEITLTYTVPDPSVPQLAQYKTGESVSEGELDAQNNSLVYLYFEGHAMESVDYTQITVGGNAIQSWQLGFWPNDNPEQFYITFGNAMPLVAGDYTVVVPEGAIKFADGKVNEEIELEYYVEAKPIQTTATFSDNANGGYVEVALPEALTASILKYAYQLEGVVTVVDAQNNAVEYGVVLGNEGDNKLTVTLNERPAAGTYTVTIGADLLAPGYYADFTVLPAPVYVDVLDYAYPAAGEVKVEAFANGLYIYTNSAFEAVEGAKATVNGEEAISFFYGGDQNIFVSLLNVEAGNTYTVVIPAGAIRVADYTYNEEITLTYTIPVDPITVPVEQYSQYVYVTLPVTTTDWQNWGWAYGEYQGAIPAGLEVLDPKGNAVAVKSAYYYWDSTSFGIELEEVPTAGGEYTVNIPAGVVTGLAAPLTGKFIIPVKPVVVDVQQGGQYVYVSLPATTTDYNSWGIDMYGDQHDAVPAGLEVLDVEGNPVAIQGAWYSYESDVLAIYLEATPEVYGEYTVNVPADVVTGIEVPMTGKFTVSPVPGATINFVAEDPNVSGMYWATYYADYAWEVPAGVFAYTVTGIDEHNRAETALVEDVVPAKTGVVLVRMEAGEVKIVKSNESPAPIEGNLLRGVTTDQTVTAADGESLYKLSYNNDETKLGFYWDAANGASLEATAYKAYLAVPAAAASNGISVRFGELTGIDTVLASEAGEAIYNLQGQRVSAAQAGVYVKNGKKFIVK